MSEFSSRSGLSGVVSTDNGNLDFSLSNEFLRNKFADSSNDGAAGIEDDTGEFPSFVLESFFSRTFLKDVGGNNCCHSKQFLHVPAER